MGGDAGRLGYDDLTAAFFKGWGKSLGAPPPHGPGHKQNYVRKLLTSTRTAVREAVLRGEAPDGFRDPFERLRGDSVLAAERAKKPSLSIDQVRAIMGAEAQPASLVEVVRDAFAFAFFVGGMRFGDVCLLRWGAVRPEGEGRPAHVVYNAEKTGKAMDVPLPPEAVGILDRYATRASRGPRSFVFPFLDRRDVSTPAKRRQAIQSLNAYANAKLKVLARRAGIPDPDRVTTHVARHSHAGHLYDVGVAPHTIKQVLAHSRFDTTENYISGLDRGRLDGVYLSAFTESEGAGGPAAGPGGAGKA